MHICVRCIAPSQYPQRAQSVDYAAKEKGVEIRVEIPSIPKRCLGSRAN